MCVCVLMESKKFKKSFFFEKRFFFVADPKLPFLSQCERPTRSLWLQEEEEELREREDV